LKEIGVGIIGFGFMGRAHTYGYKTIPLYYRNLPFKIKLVGVCNRTFSTAQEARDALGFEFATSNTEDIFDRDDIDVVNICTPNIYHKEAVINAIKAGKHIYCDKPLTANFEESREILKILQGSNIIHQMALQNRFFPATMRAKELIDEGRIGRILSFRACYLHSGSVDRNKPIGWKQDHKIGGGGVLLDLGPHALDLLYYLLGEYASIFAKSDVIYRQRPDRDGNMVDIDAEDQIFMIARMKNGGLGTIEASKVATGTNDELRFEIHGDRGAIAFNLMDPNWLDYFDNTVKEAPLGGYRGYTRIECVQRYQSPGGEFPSPKGSIGWIRAHVHSLYNFLSAVYENRQASPSLKDGAYIQYVMDKAYESDRENRWIDIHDCHF
jgi:predicted dehydrogenase